MRATEKKLKINLKKDFSRYQPISLKKFYAYNQPAELVQQNEVAIVEEVAKPAKRFKDMTFEEKLVNIETLLLSFVSLAALLSTGFVMSTGAIN